MEEITQLDTISVPDLGRLDGEEDSSYLIAEARNRIFITEPDLLPRSF